MGKIKVTNGTDSYEIDSGDLDAAVKDGFKPTERIVVANSKTKESYEIDPNDVQHALKEGFTYQDIVKYHTQQPKQEQPAFQLSEPTLRAIPKESVVVPSVPNEPINIKQSEVQYVPDEKTYKIQQQQGKAKAAHEKVNAALVSNDTLYEKKLRESRRDNFTIESLRNEYKKNGQILSPQDEQRLLQKEKDRLYNLPVTKEELTDFKTGTILTPKLSRKFIKDLNDKDVAESAYQVDKFNELASDPDPNAHNRIEKINEVAKGIKKGTYVYDPETKTVVQPIGTIGSIMEGVKNKFKADDEHYFFKNTKNDAAIISQLEDERNNPDLDEPIKVPRGKVNEALKSVAEMPVLPMVAGVAGTVGGTFIGNPELGTVAATALGAYENRKAQYTSTFKQVYNEMRNQGKPEFDALTEARRQAENAQEIGTITGAAQGYLGAKIGEIPVKGASFNLGYQKAVGDFLKKNGSDLGKIVLDAVAQGGIGTAGEITKNKLAQAAGIKRDWDEGTENAFWGNALMTAGIGAAIKLGRGMSKLNYKTILSGLTKSVPEEAINSALQEKVSSGEITQAAADQALNEINQYKEKDAQIPPNVTEEARFKIQDNIDKLNKLQALKEATHESLHEPIKEKIQELIKENLALAKETVKEEKPVSGLEKSKEKEAVDFAHELVDEGVLPDTYHDAVKKDPIKFWQTVAQQAQNRDENWKPLSNPLDEQAIRDNYGDTVVDYAKELFPAPPEEVNDATHIDNFNKAKAEWDKLSTRDKKLKRADYELDDLHHSEGGYYKVGDTLFDLGLSDKQVKLFLDNKKVLNILNKLGVTKIHGVDRPAHEMFGHYSDGKIHLNINTPFENVTQLSYAVFHELGHHEFTKLSGAEKEYINSLPLETGMARKYAEQERNGGKQTAASLQEENFADYVMQYFQGKLYGDEPLLNKIPTRLREMFDYRYGDLVGDNKPETQPSKRISVIQPGEIKQPETITIKPQENAQTIRGNQGEISVEGNVGEQRPDTRSENIQLDEGAAPGASETEQQAGIPAQESSAKGQEGIGSGGKPPTGKPMDMADYGEGGKELDKLANNIPDSGKVAEYMSKDTIEKYTNETPTNDQTRGVQELGIALAHGEKIIEKAKELFGNDYVDKTLDYIDNSTAGVSNKALMYVSMENALGREKLAFPERAAEISKQQELVYAKSQAFARENSLALNYQKLRRIARVGYDLNQVTEHFFSPEEKQGRNDISKAVQADADAVNKQAEQVEGGEVSPDVENAVKAGVEKEIESIYSKLPKDKKTAADKAIAALDRLHNRLRGKAYESTIGIPVAIIDGAVLTIRNAIKAGVKIADAVEMGIAKVKEKYKDWAKEDEFRKDILNGFREQGITDEVKEKTISERVATAEHNIQKKIDAIRDEIIAGERKEKTKKDKLQSKKLDQLREQKKSLETLRDKYLPKGENPYANEKAAKAIEKKLINENIELNRQIEKGEKDKVENKVTIESDAIDKLKAERDARKEILEALDPTPKDYVKNALIQQGFGREKVIKGEKKQILDWKKLAGAAGTVSKISENVGKVLENDGFSESQLERIKDAFIKEYVDLRASIIEKAQTELARRNKESVTQEQKSAAKKLAEMYTYGLFDSQPDAFENALNKALGAKVSEQGFNEAREIAKGMETLYSSSFQGVKLNDISAKMAIEHLSNKMRLLLARESKGQGNFNFRAANIVRNYFDLQQTMVLNNLKQAVENPLSGLQQEVIEKIGGMIGKEGIGTAQMGAQRRTLMKTIYKDMVLNGSIGYGKTESAFVNRTHLDDHIDKLSDNKLYHGVMSVLSGKATLNAADAMFKASLTEKKFAHNLLKILMHDTNPNRMSASDAINFVSEKLTGQTLKDAKVSAKEIIEKINKDAGNELIPTNEESINRFANDIVKASLEMGGKITTDQITAAYNAAYKAAGLGLGHEANNILSSTVSGYSAKLEKRINEAVEGKEWNRAAILTAQSILFRNVLNPFVGGGTNWLVLKFEKTGLGLLTGLGYKLGSNTKIDLSTELGMKTLEKRLYNQSRIKDNYMRGLVGGAASALTYLAFTGLANTDEYRKWRGKNQWAARYLDIITPEMLLTKMAVENKAVKKYIASTINKNDAFDATTKLMTAADNAVKGHKDKALGALGEAIGSKFNVPLPWRLVKDGQVIYQGVTGQDPYHGNYKPSTGFLNGVFQGGAIEWVGLRPAGNISNSGSARTATSHKKITKTKHVSHKHN